MVDPQIMDIFEYIKAGANTLCYCTIILGSTYLGYKVVRDGINLAIDYGKSKIPQRNIGGSLEKIVEKDDEE